MISLVINKTTNTVIDYYESEKSPTMKYAELGANRIINILAEEENIKEFKKHFNRLKELNGEKSNNNTKNI